MYANNITTIKPYMVDIYNRSIEITRELFSITIPQWSARIISNNSTKTLWNFLDSYIDTETIYTKFDNSSPRWAENLIFIGQVTMYCALVFSVFILILQYINLSSPNRLRDDIEYNTELSENSDECLDYSDDSSEDNNKDSESSENSDSSEDD
jgi:hypothetical protein